MVIGKINQIFPEYKIRFSTMKKRFDKTFDDLFILSDEECSITDGALDQVEQVTYTSPVIKDYTPMNDYYSQWKTYDGGARREINTNPRGMDFLYDDNSWFEDGVPVKQATRSNLPMNMNPKSDEISYYDMLKLNAMKGKEFSIQELMGEDW